ncbi:hypothetical protein PybrP1_006297 [[Pythium] brassicae (nom. inval.)]|nr:hypothetical protein PybrP1_006297 [[Pythium] brassicae (nom. inval.)]
MHITIVEPAKAKRAFGRFELPDAASVADLKSAFAAQTRISRHRLSFKLPSTATDSDGLVSLSDDSKSLASYGVKSGSELLFKDLGPQIGYRTVFLVEYFGPLALMLLCASRPALLYGADAAAAQPFSATARLGVLAWSAHYVKRELESVFVHRFSRATMPLFNLFKNCSAYWLAGAAVGYQLCHPAYEAPSSQLQKQLGLALFMVSEFLNFCVHVQLRNLRPAEGSTARPVPMGLLFALVSCPNYTFEVLGWVGFSVFTQMAEWALKKHRGYLRNDGDAYKKLRRKVIVPFVL